MNTYEIIKELARRKKVSIAEIERTLNLSNGSISKWGKNKPNSEPLEKVATYFGVSVDYLLGRDEKALDEDLEDSLDSAMLYSGKKLNDADRATIKAILKGYFESKDIWRSCLLNIEEIAKKNNIDVHFCEMSEDGGYIQFFGKKLIFINNKLNDHAAKRVFYHEMSHVLNHSEMKDVYNLTYSKHSQIETDANRDMIKNEIRDIIEFCDNDDSSILNWKRIAEIIDIPITSTVEWLIKEELSEYYLS